MKKLALAALVCLAACSGGGPTDHGPADGGTTHRPDDAGMVSPDCTGCGANQVCDNGVCTDLPASCPCPLESYCDVASNTCKPGCLEDDQCSSGRICITSSRTCQIGCRADGDCAPGQICDNLMCHPGCRMDGDCAVGQICNNDSCQAGCRADGDCAPGQICDNLACRAGCRQDTDCGASGVVCDPATLTCRGGCRQSSDCPKEQICGSSLTCVAGCDADGRCNAGRICVSGMCQDGCRTTTDCPLDQYCDSTSMKCVDGCPEGDPSHCQIGEACVNYQDGTNKCASNCYEDYTCNDSTYACFTSNANDTITQEDVDASRCRKKCSTNSDCPSGYLCGLFGISRTAPNEDYTYYCVKPCTQGDYCGSAVPDIIDPTSSCMCGSDGTCQYPGGSVGCYIVDPAAGI